MADPITGNQLKAIESIKKIRAEREKPKPKQMPGQRTLQGDLGPNPNTPQTPRVKLEDVKYKG